MDTDYRGVGPVLRLDREYICTCTERERERERDREIES